MNARKIVNRLHLWIGLASGIFVFLISISGAVLVFEDELKPLVYAGKYNVDYSTTGNVLPLHVMQQIAQERFGKSKPVSAIEIINNKGRSVRFRAYQDNQDTDTWYWDEKKYYESVFIHPYTGKIIAWENSEFEFFRVALYLHWSLLLTTSVGQPIVGIVTLLFVCSLLSGLFLWWPRNKKAQRKRLTFNWKAQTGIKRKIYDLHNILGFYVSLLALLVALIGLTWAFPSFGNAVAWIANGGKAPQENARLTSTVAGINTAAIDVALKNVARSYLKADAYYFYLPKNPLATINVIITNQDKRYRAITAQYDQYSGALLKANTFDEQSNGEQLREISYDIHLGRIAGFSTKVIAFFLALICGSLPITGVLIWIRRNKAA